MPIDYGFDSYYLQNPEPLTRRVVLAHSANQQDRDYLAAADAYYFERTGKLPPNYLAAPSAFKPPATQVASESTISPQAVSSPVGALDSASLTFMNAVVASPAYRCEDRLQADALAMKLRRWGFTVTVKRVAAGVFIWILDKEKNA